MKFSFPFFGKKSKPLEPELENIPAEDMPMVEEEKPVINWNAVQAGPMPGLEVVSEGPEVREADLTIPVTSPSPVISQSVNNDANEVSKAQAAKVEEIEESLIEPRMIEKVAVSQEAPLKPLEIEDLLKAQPLVIPDVIPDAMPEATPELIADVDPNTTPNLTVSEKAAAVNTQASIASPAVATPASTSKPLLMTREDVIAAYKIFLNRLPESFEVIQSRVNSSVEANLIDFALADEFIKRADLPVIIFPIAKKILESQEQS